VFEKMFTLTGAIGSGAYLSYAPNFEKNGITKYVLTFQIQTEKGPGELELNVAQQGSEPYRLTGLNIYSTK
jgi:hypothetical protein